MKNYVLLHCGFEQPTPEVMEAWGNWFVSIADRSIQDIGFGAAKEISSDGTRDIPWGPDSITGCSIITAEDMDDAMSVAATCPYVGSIRVYEVRGH